MAMKGLGLNDFSRFAYSGCKPGTFPESPGQSMQGLRSTSSSMLRSDLPRSPGPSAGASFCLIPESRGTKTSIPIARAYALLPNKPLDWTRNDPIMRMNLIWSHPMNKTLSFAALHFTVAFLLGWLFTGSLLVGGALALVEPACNTVVFHFHEKVWKRIEARRAVRAAGQSELALAARPL